MPANTSILKPSRTRSIAFCGLTVALMAVSAWITVPFGPVPFTLQTFAMVFALLALSPAEAVASIAIYLGMGAIGLPMFSSMRGGIGVLAGPTGGFLWGYLLGALLVVVYLRFAAGGVSAKERPIVHDIVAAAIFMVVCYLCGWVQLALVSGMGFGAAFGAAVAPFVIIDTIKAAFAIIVARAVRKAVG